VGHLNKAEALFLLSGHAPRHRKWRDNPFTNDDDFVTYPPEILVHPQRDEHWHRQWYESTRRVAERNPDNALKRDMEQRYGPKGSLISDSEVEAFLGAAPQVEDLPGWLRAAVLIEDGGLGEPEEQQRRWDEVQQVTAPFYFIRRPKRLGIVYGLLGHFSYTTDSQGHRQSWPSVIRMAEVAGYTAQWVERTLRELEQAEAITTEMRSGTSSLYTLLLDDKNGLEVVYELGQKNLRPKLVF
jgi:hypothetical protein